MTDETLNKGEFWFNLLEFDKNSKWGIREKMFNSLLFNLSYCRQF